MADYWLKLYIEILDDPKMATLPDRVWRRIIELFLIAKRQGKEGHLPDTRQLAWVLRMNADELEADMAQIAQTGIVIREVNGWYIPKFAQRQAAVTDAERQRQKREREHTQQYYGDVTNVSRNVTQSTESETESEAETETEQSAPATAFDLFKRTCEIRGVLASTGADVKAMAEWVRMGVTVEDVAQAITWRIEHSTNDKALYAYQLNGAVQTEMSKRKTNGSVPRKDPVFTEEY
jgi:hypothetical protein